ncbi:hypothetical protein RND71_038362 [Anisodus tanguticus]|uniref:Uncharacterized protein n=1 Tax=Anisodus tanguticus TaxID=243964 RepID=A0AAE1QZW4_9SOLA|nr:hypothetical protein RND71_038362 [Anisodus tanguticus]
MAIQSINEDTNQIQKAVSSFRNLGRLTTLTRVQTMGVTYRLSYVFGVEIGVLIHGLIREADRLSWGGMFSWVEKVPSSYNSDQAATTRVLKCD